MRLLHTTLYRADLRTRMPVKYGIATMTSVPHVFVRVECEVAGRPQAGVAADLLPPKWFTKDPRRDPSLEIDDMIRVIQQAQDHAMAVASHSSVFGFWRAMSERQNTWARCNRVAPLLANFGISLVERALIDAYCRARGETFGRALRENSLGIILGSIHPDLAETDPSAWLPPQPASRIFARHTVGMADPLTDAEIHPSERIDDGLPQSLECCIATYGLRHFKLKIGGKRDVARLTAIAAVLDRQTPDDYLCSLDGNEAFRSVEAFRAVWMEISGEPRLARLRDRIIFVEQPFERELALSAEVGAQLGAWPTRPPIVIDESDAELGSLPLALSLGYAGTTHKNCKGVFKGIANACFMAQRKQTEPHAHWSFTGEDLGNIGPVSLLQDLAVQASIGVSTVERNGHHYFAGLSFWPKALQDAVIAHHPDLYQDSRDGWPTLRVADGQVIVSSVCAAPFGAGFDFDPATVARLVPGGSARIP